MRLLTIYSSNFSALCVAVDGNNRICNHGGYTNEF